MSEVQRLSFDGLLPEPSPLVSSGSSCTLSFHSRGASHGVTVTAKGVLSSSTTKKYLGEGKQTHMSVNPDGRQLARTDLTGSGFVLVGQQRQKCYFQTTACRGNMEMPVGES